MFSVSAPCSQLWALNLKNLWESLLTADAPVGFSLDSAEVRVTKFEPDTMEEIVLQMIPVRSTLAQFGKCATYNLDSEREKMTRIEVLSRMDFTAIFHDKNQQNVHREISASFKPRGKWSNWFRKTNF